MTRFLPSFALRVLCCLMGLCCASLALPEASGAEAVTTVGIATDMGDVDPPLAATVKAALRDSVNAPGIVNANMSFRQSVDLIRLNRDRLYAVLRAFGFYGGHVDVFVNGRSLFEDRTDRVPSQANPEGGRVSKIVFTVNSGPRYKIRSVDILWIGREPDRTHAPVESTLPDDVIGQPATAQTLAGIEAGWLSRRREGGHGLAAVLLRAVLPDSAGAQTVDVTLVASDGPQLKLGGVRFDGLTRLDANLLQRYVPFQPGDPYQPVLIDQLRIILQQLDLFQSVNIELEASDSSGVLPVTVIATEKPPRREDLPVLGSLGGGVLGLTAAMFAAYLFAGAGGASPSQRYHPYLRAICHSLLIVSAAIIVQRVLYLANL